MKGTIYINITAAFIGLLATFCIIFFFGWTDPYEIFSSFGAGLFFFFISYLGIRIALLFVNKEYAEKLFAYEKEKNAKQRVIDKKAKQVWLEEPKILPNNVGNHVTSHDTKPFILNGLCACDRCGKDLHRGDGCLNNRNTRLYCEGCWNHIKSIDPNGEELTSGEMFVDGVKRTNLNWR